MLRSRDPWNPSDPTFGSSRYGSFQGMAGVKVNQDPGIARDDLTKNTNAVSSMCQGLWEVPDQATTKGKQPSLFQL